MFFFNYLNSTFALVSRLITQSSPFSRSSSQFGFVSTNHRIGESERFETLFNAKSEFYSDIIVAAAAAALIQLTKWNDQDSLA